MTLSDLSIRRPVFAWMLMAGLIVFGGVSFMRLGVSQLPDVDFPVITVNVTLTGAAPEVMETDVVDVIENSVSTIQGVRKITSTSRSGAATIAVEFDLGRDIDQALQEVQSKVAEAQKKLPREIDPPVLSKTNPEDQPIMWLALSSTKHSLRELMEIVRDRLQPQFSTAPDVGDINLGGYVDPNLRVWVNSKDLSKYQLTAVDVINAIQNEHSEPPAGNIQVGPKEFNVRSMGEARTIEDFSTIAINNRGGSPNFTPIPLSKVARVEDGLADVRRISRALGVASVGMGIRKQRGSNAVQVARGVRTRMAEVQKTLPEGMTLAVNFDSTRFIEDSVHELNLTLVLAAVLTGLVCWLFLGSWSSTINVLLAIPTSIVGTFMVLYFAGFTLNLFTLLALSLAIGIVVDDAIMVLENILRHREMGKNKRRAALDGAREITFAALAATISIVAIFLPVAFMAGVIGRFFFQFGVTLSVAVLLSLLEALTLTPMRCAEFVDKHERTTRFGKWVEARIEWMRHTYARSLGVVLKHRWVTIGAALAVFAVGLYPIRFLNSEFLPPEDQSRFLIRLKTPVGSSLAFTDSKFREVEALLKARPEVDRYFIAVGGFGGGEVNTGVAFVTMKNKGQRGIASELGREPTQFDLMNICRTQMNKIPDVKVVIQDLSLRGFTASRGFPIEFSIQGPNWEQLGQLSQKLMKDLSDTGLVTDVDSDYDLGMPEIQVVPDREKAAQRGVSVATIGTTINALIGGVIVGKYPKDGRRIDIRLKLDETKEAREKRIENLYVRNNRGELIPLSDVVQIHERPTLLSVVRLNRERAVSVFANVAKGKSQQDALKAASKLGAGMPDGYRVSLTGGSESFTEARTSLIFALIMGLIVAYMVLASQFNSFIDPISVLAALPFSITGAFVALLVCGHSLNVFSLIGLLLLMGIVKKNSILLVDYTNHARDRGEKDVTKALLEACPTRLRPILMTSIATVVGAIPAALSFGPGAETRAPMATVVIGGVLVSTILTLYVVPCVYSVLSRLENRKTDAELEAEEQEPAAA